MSMTHGFSGSHKEVMGLHGDIASTITNAAADAMLPLLYTPVPDHWCLPVCLLRFPKYRAAI